MKKELNLLSVLGKYESNYDNFIDINSKALTILYLIKEIKIHNDEKIFNALFLDSKFINSIYIRKDLVCDVFDYLLKNDFIKSIYIKNLENNVYKSHPGNHEFWLFKNSHNQFAEFGNIELKSTFHIRGDITDKNNIYFSKVYLRDFNLWLGEKFLEQYLEYFLKNNFKLDNNENFLSIGEQIDYIGRKILKLSKNKGIENIILKYSDFSEYFNKKLYSQIDLLGVFLFLEKENLIKINKVSVGDDFSHIGFEININENFLFFYINDVKFKDVKINSDDNYLYVKGINSKLTLGNLEQIILEDILNGEKHLLTKYHSKDIEGTIKNLRTKLKSIGLLNFDIKTKDFKLEGKKVFLEKIKKRY